MTDKALRVTAALVVHNERILIAQRNNVGRFANKWEFPGGTPATSTDVDPIVVYTKAGNYDVTLEAKNPRCSSKLTVL